MPIVPGVARAILHAFYRIEIAGEEPPAEGALLAVANHPNMIADPGMVLLAVGRPARFMAKAPLFSSVLTRGVLRAAGTLPVYRPSDDPALTNLNDEVFRAVHEALAGGSAVGIFPEGTSHDAPSIVPLRTGAARIALGSPPEVRATLRIQPVGIVYRRKTRFRSAVLLLRGAPVAWDDLRGKTDTDVAAVRELTARIGRAMRDLTLNLDRWEDGPLIESVDAMYRGEFDLPGERVSRVERARVIAEALRYFRERQEQGIDDLIAEIEDLAAAAHAAGTTLDRAGDEIPLRVAVNWSVRTAAALAVALPVLLAGHVVFAVPYGLATLLVRRVRVEAGSRATLQMFGGGAIYAVWTLALALVAGRWFGWPAGVATFVALPVLAFVTIRLREWLIGAWRAARSYLAHWSRADVAREIATRRAGLVQRLESLRAEFGRKREE